MVDDSAEGDRIALASFRNREGVVQASMCGCYYCLSTFPGSEVHDWVDDGRTALCPRCGFDAVLANVTDETTLQSLRHHRFETAYRFDAAGNPIRA